MNLTGGSSVGEVRQMIFRTDGRHDFTFTSRFLTSSSVAKMHCYVDLHPEKRYDFEQFTPYISEGHICQTESLPPGTGISQGGHFASTHVHQHHRRNR